MRKIYKILPISMGITLFAMSSVACFAGEVHHQHSAKQNSAERMGGHRHAEHGHDNAMDIDAAMDNHGGMFLLKKEVDAYTVSFHVMKAKAGMEHGGSHNLMVKVEKNGVLVNDIMVNSKVFYADKTTDSKMLMKMGDWYMAGYDLGQQGQHGLMVLFKTADGKKHKTSVYYPEEK